jgi:D-beta-D-heptose 7-phosphate kinase/D-beta-D-heptose 1-phosphate adenosyltransferase
MQELRPWDFVSLYRQAAMIITREELPHYLAALRAEGKRIVFTNGCFDILHRGHVEYLSAARQLGDVLIVGLNSDASVRRLKGPERPINSQEDRAAVLDALRAVDAVTIFEEDTPAELIATVQPDVLVKGGDYTEATVVGADLVRSRGGRVVIVPLVEGRSTSAVIARLRGLA